MPDPVFLLAFAALGAVVGFVAGLLGVGGGGIAVPVLTALFLAMGRGDAVHLALGTSMAAMIVTSFSSMRSHRAHGNVRGSLVAVMAPAVILGTFAATFVAARAPARALAVFFAGFMAFVAWRMFRAARSDAPARALLPRPLLFAGGAGIGAVSALVSIGGGSLTVPFLGWQGVDIRKAIGTSAAIGFPIAIAGTLGYVLNGLGRVESGTGGVIGFVHVPAAVLIASTSFFLVPVGARMANRIPVVPLKRIFACVLMLLALKMLHSVLA